MAHVLHIHRHRLVSPAAAAEYEPMIWQSFRDFEKELFNARFAIWQTIREECEITDKPFISSNGMMRVRIERVVDRHAHLRAERLVTAHNRFAAAVGQDQIVTGNQIRKRI